MFPLVVAHLTSANYVAHTYAAVCVERILCMKDAQQHLMYSTRRMWSIDLFSFTPQDLKPFLEPLLVNLFKLIESGQTPEKVLILFDFAYIYIGKVCARVSLSSLDATCRLLRTTI